MLLLLMSFVKKLTSFNSFVEIKEYLNDEKEGDEESVKRELKQSARTLSKVSNRAKIKSLSLVREHVSKMCYAP